MTENTTYRSVSLAVLVILAAAVGAVAVTGTVAAQDAGDDETDGELSTGNATDESFYTPSAEDPLNVRFRDCCGHTVHSVDEGVLNLNIVYGMVTNSELYDVKITASGLSESQIESIVFDSANYDTENLGRTDIVGTNFTGVPSGEYVFTVSVVGTDATEMVMLEVTDGPSATTDETMDNATAGNETGMDNATTDETMAGNETQLENDTQMGDMTGNVSISAMPNTTGTLANYTISVPVSEASAGNLSAIAINFTGTNASLFGVAPASIYAVNITQPNGSVITAAGNVTAVSGGFTGLKAIIQFDENKTVSADDRILIRFGGVTNPSVEGTYSIGIDVNPERGNVTRTAFLTIAKNATVSNETQMGNETGIGNATQMGNMTNTTGNVSISVTPNTTGAVANYTISIPVSAGSAGNLSAIAINFTGTNASLFGVAPTSIYAVNITQPNGSVITAAGNVTAVSGGFTGLKAIIQFDENKTISAGDRILVRFGGVTNPAKPGIYNISIDANPDRGNITRSATFTIARNDSAGTNATTTPTTTATEMGAATASGTAMGTAMATGTDLGTVSQTATGGDGGTGGNGSDGGQQGTQAGGPGFGIAVAVVALLAAALLAVRRN